jgi:hypothetical protein
MSPGWDWTWLLLLDAALLVAATALILALLLRDLRRARDRRQK